MTEATIDELVKRLNTAVSLYKDNNSATARSDIVKAARSIIATVNEPADEHLQLTYAVKLSPPVLLYSHALRH